MQEGLFLCGTSFADSILFLRSFAKGLVCHAVFYRKRGVLLRQPDIFEEILISSRAGKRFNPHTFLKITAIWYNCEESHSEQLSFMMGRSFSLL